MTGALEMVAASCGESSAIVVLEQGEDHGMVDYLVDLKLLDVETQALVTTELIPAQQETLRVVTDLAREVAQRWA